MSSPKSWIKSHQVTKSKRPCRLEVSIQHQKAAMLRRGPGCLRQPFCWGGSNLSAEVSTLDCGIDPVGGPGAITATAGSFFFWLGCWGLPPCIVQTHGCKMNWKCHRSFIRQFREAFQVSRLFTTCLCLYRNAPQAFQKNQVRMAFLLGPRSSQSHFLRRCATSSRVAWWAAMAVFIVYLCASAAQHHGPNRRWSFGFCQVWAGMILTKTC